MHTVVFENGILTIETNGRIIRHQPFDPRTQLAWADAATAEAWAAEEVAALGGQVSRIVSPKAYAFRFTLLEHAAILTATKENMLVRAIYDRMRMADFIDLEDAEVKAGLAYYVSEGLVTEERAATILSAPVMDKERP